MASGVDRRADLSTCSFMALYSLQAAFLSLHVLASILRIDSRSCVCLAKVDGGREEAWLHNCLISVA